VNTHIAPDESMAAMALLQNWKCNGTVESVQSLIKELNDGAQFICQLPEPCRLCARSMKGMP
jgi:hypothetical protein